MSAAHGDHTQPAQHQAPQGTHIAQGELIGELHLWGEPVPRMPRSGAALAWGLRAYPLIVRSLRLLVQHSADDPVLSSLPAGYGSSSFLPKAMGEPDALTRLGFAVVRHASPSSYLQQFIAFWDNASWWMLAWTFNPSSLEYRQLLRLERWEIWIPTWKLKDRYVERER